MSDIRISKREFVRHAGKYLVPGRRYVLEGREEIVVEVSFSPSLGMSDKPSVEMWHDDYGCGCKKVGGQMLCKKHGRY